MWDRKIMISKADWLQLLKRSLVVIALLIVFIVIGLAISVVSARRAANSFELASDFPRGAMVYAQFKDLPAMLKQWDESSLKDRYLGSVNYQQLQTRHLAIKLVSRWNEFNDATGFPIDTSALGAIADNRAAIAVYDIGRLELVLIAPLSDEKFAATQFFQSKGNFEEIESPDGVAYYLSDVEADKGRQKQQIGFVALKGRFVLATSEKLLLRAIANINGQAKKDRLSDEPSFQSLSKAVTPHFVTVWVNQSALNDDWYFKRYWAMQNIADLKHIRAGMFDLELQQNKWIERREFLTDGKATKTGAALSPQALQRIERIVPADAPFAQIRSADGDQTVAVELVRDALFDGKVERAKKSRDWSWHSYDSSDFEVASEDEEYYGSSRYSYLSYKYNLEIDDPGDTPERGDDDDSAIRLKGEEKFSAALRSALQPARPTLVAKIAQPRAIDGPLFAEFRRATIISLQNPSSLDRASLERAIADLAASRLMIAGATTRFEWKDRSANGAQWREMQLPMLGRAVGYGVRGQELIISNNPELLASLVSERQSKQRREIRTSSPVHELTVIRLGERQTAFDQIFMKLDEPRIKAYWKERRGEEVKHLGPNEPSREFFSGEVASLLDVAAPVEEIRIQRSYAAGRLREEVALVLK
jgi:hypothetical protein